MKTIFFIRIPHQMPVSVGTHLDDQSEAEDAVDNARWDSNAHESWAFWFDSHLTLPFDTLEEMSEWAEKYQRHQAMQVRQKVADFISQY